MEKYEHIHRVKSGGGSDYNDNEFPSGDYTQSNGYHHDHTHMGGVDVTDAIMTRGGGDTQGNMREHSVQRPAGSAGVTSQNRGGCLKSPKLFAIRRYNASVYMKFSFLIENKFKTNI